MPVPVLCETGFRVLRLFDNMTPLTPEAVHKALGRFFPKRNDDFPSDYVEEMEELRVFGIDTQEELDEMLHRRAEEAMEIDRSPLSESDIRMHRRELGDEFVAYRLREGFWFSYPALLRIALELEFGKAYEEYADRRDRIVEPGAPPNSRPTSPLHTSLDVQAPDSLRTPSSGGCG